MLTSLTTLPSLDSCQADHPWLPHLGPHPQVIEAGKANRSTFATNMNEHSSRSHLVLSVYVVGQCRQGGASCRAKLHLIDLAGSERVSRSGAEGEGWRWGWAGMSGAGRCPAFLPRLSACAVLGSPAG
jgi:hypothetical protein